MECGVHGVALSPRQSTARTLLSEDTQHGQESDGVRIVNPLL